METEVKALWITPEIEDFELAEVVQAGDPTSKLISDGLTPYS